MISYTPPEIVENMLNIPNLFINFSKLGLGRLFVKKSETCCFVERCHTYTPVVDLLIDRVYVDLHMICSVRIHWIICNAQCGFVITGKVLLNSLLGSLVLPITELTDFLHMFLE